MTLSVPELLKDVLAAFAAELLEILPCTIDLSTATAVKGDKITARLALLPTAVDYDSGSEITFPISWDTGMAYNPATGFGFSAQAAESLLTDISIILDTLKHVPVVVKWLSQVSAKQPLYLEGVRNTAYALVKFVIDSVLARATSANFTRSFVIPPVLVDLGVMEAIRGQMNLQRCRQSDRVMICNPSFADRLQADPRTLSRLFYDQRNGPKALRRWKDLCGFGQVLEYSDFPDNGEHLQAFAWDPRAFALACRQIAFTSQLAEQLGVPKIMEFTPVTDPSNNLSMTGVAWQQPGTGDLFISPAILFGLAAGAQGDGPGGIVDFAGLRITSE